MKSVNRVFRVGCFYLPQATAYMGFFACDVRKQEKNNGVIGGKVVMFIF